MSKFRNDLTRFRQNHNPIVMWCAAHHNDLACEKDGRRQRDQEGCQVYGYKSLREEQNLAVKGILSGRDVFVHAHAKDKTHVCLARDRVRDFLEYFKLHENSEC